MPFLDSAVQPSVHLKFANLSHTATPAAVESGLLRQALFMSRGAFCCACPVNFSLIRETAGMRLRRFPFRESRKKRSSKIGLRRFRYLSSSLLSSSLHVPYRITEFATYHNRVRYLYLDAKFKTCSREVVGAITWHNSV